MTVRLVDMPIPPPKPREALWTISKGAERIDAELVEQGKAVGWELVLLRNHECVSGRLFVTRAEAVTHADDSRSQLLDKGWTAVTST